MPRSPRPLRLGCERIAEHDALFRGKRIGVVTNHTGVDRAGTRTIDLLRAGYDVRTLFSPEHGLEGAAGAGDAVASGRDAASGLAVHSLYGATTRPTDEMLASVDVLVYDIQDVAARCFTYVTTLAEVMRAAAARGIPLVILDRPDPLGPVPPDGPVLDRRFASFVGAAPVPLRYALTPGELARAYRELLDVDCDLTVVPLQGWRRDWLDATGLPFVPPSPALRTLEACALYAGTVLFEGTNVSEGRGTDDAFAWVGAPWLDMAAIARDIDAPAYGARLAPETRRPRAAKFAGEDCAGLRLTVTDRARLRPVALAVAVLTTILDRHRRELLFDDARFDRLAGTDALRRALAAGDAAEAIVASWRPALARFEEIRARGSLY